MHTSLCLDGGGKRDRIAGHWTKESPVENPGSSGERANMKGTRYLIAMGLIVLMGFVGM